MSDPSSIYEHFRCTICLHRLNKPLELICKHLACRECLETILRNHRTDACCRQCKAPLQKYRIEDYSYLSEDHHVCRLLSTFTDIDQCETCTKFTHVKACADCSKNQCGDCLSKHQEKYHRPNIPSPSRSSTIIQVFTEKEQQILESLRTILTEKEYEDFVYIAQQHLHRAAVAADVHRSSSSASPASPITTNSTYEPKKNMDEKPVVYSPLTPYDWSKHPRITADDIVPSNPTRVKELLRLNFEPRQYQITMARGGLRRENSLICLQTGAGKTYIAGMIAKFFYIQSLQSSPTQTRFSIVAGRSRRFKAVFLVPIKALVDQQCAAYRNVFIDQSETILKPIDNQAGERFRDLYDQFTLFFFTVQKFANFLESRFTNLTDFDLIIIDECHHCYDNHPTNAMMRLYHRAKASGARVPQIIGLTASVGTNKKKAFDHLVHLCANLDCFDICAIERQSEQEEVRRTTNTPMADTIIPVPRTEVDPIVNKLKFEVMQRIAGRLGLDIFAFDTEKLENYLVLTHQKACVQSDRDLILGTDYLRKFNRFLLQYNDLPLKQCLNKLEEVFQETTTAAKPTDFEQFCRERLNEFLTFARTELSRNCPISAKLQKLVGTILELHKPNDRGLILVRTKFHTIALEQYLNNHPLLSQRGLKVGYMTGQGSAEEMCLPGSQQATVLKQFRDGSKQILVATDVAQEGLDVPECSYVIRYEFVSNEIGTVQSRGRARAEQSRCFLITENLSLNYQRELENRTKEEEMKKAIDERRKRTDEEFRLLVEKEQADMIHGLCKSDADVATASEPSTLTSPASPSSSPVEVLCRVCDTHICSGCDLRTQGTTVVCIGPDFERRINPPKNNRDKFVCPNSSCHKEIGAVIILYRNVPGYALDIAALKFRDLHDQKTQIFKKWSLYRGPITPL